MAAGLVRRATSKAVCDVLVGSLHRYGIPDEILTDNGKVFTGRSVPTLPRSCSTGSFCATRSTTTRNAPIEVSIFELQPEGPSGRSQTGYAFAGSISSAA